MPDERTDNSSESQTGHRSTSPRYFDPQFRSTLLRDIVLRRTIICLDVYFNFLYKILDNAAYYSDSNNRRFYQLYKSTKKLENQENTNEQLAQRLIEENIITKEELIDRGYICPISAEVFLNPIQIISDDGSIHRFEKYELYTWLHKNIYKTNPATGLEIKAKNIKEDLAFAGEIEDYLRDKSKQLQTVPKPKD